MEACVACLAFQSIPQPKLDVGEPTWMPVWTAMTAITDDSLLHSAERKDSASISYGGSCLQWSSAESRGNKVLCTASETWVCQWKHTRCLQECCEYYRTVWQDIWCKQAHRMLRAALWVKKRHNVIFVCIFPHLTFSRGSDRVSPSAPPCPFPHRMWRITLTLNCPRGCVFDKERQRGWVGAWRVGGSNHKHVDPKNTDNLVSAAEAIDPSHHNPPPSPRSHKYDLINTQWSTKMDFWNFQMYFVSWQYQAQNEKKT